MVCVPCLIIPALLLFVQFIYNKVPFVKNAVHYLFPQLKIAEENAKKKTEEDTKRAQADFFGPPKTKEDDKTKKDESTADKEIEEEGETTKEGATKRNGSARLKKNSDDTQVESEDGTKKGN